MIELEKKEKNWLKKVFNYLTSIPNLPSKNWDTATFNAKAAGTMQITSGKVNDIWNAAQYIRKTFETGDYNDIDSAINTLATNTKYYRPKTDSYKGLSFEEATDALAGLCVLSNIPFNPKGEFTTFERDQFEKNTFFGQRLVYAREENSKPAEPAPQPSAQPNPQPSSQPSTPTAGPAGPAGAQPTSTQPTATSTPTTPKPTPKPQPTTSAGPYDSVPTAGNYIDGKASVHRRTKQKADPNAPVDTYKSEGSKSHLVFDMKSVPGRKETMAGDQGYLFIIAAEDSTTSRNKPVAFINPILTTKTYRNQTTNIVRMGSAHGWADLTLYFNTIKEAEDFAVKMGNANRIESKFTNVRAEKRSISGKFGKMFAHGFYRVGTELGDVYVCASKLNEAVEPNPDSTELTENTENTTIDNFDMESWKAELKELMDTAPWK